MWLIKIQKLNKISQKINDNFSWKTCFFQEIEKPVLSTRNPSSPTSSVEKVRFLVVEKRENVTWVCMIFRVFPFAVGSRILHIFVILQGYMKLQSWKKCVFLVRISCQKRVKRRAPNVQNCSKMCTFLRVPKPVPFSRVSSRKTRWVPPAVLSIFDQKTSNYATFLSDFHHQKWS